MTAGTVFEKRARAYVERALPHAPFAEKQKLVDDWLDKEEAAKGIYGDFVKRAGNPIGTNVLDIGFGNGITLLEFSRNGARVSGVEISPELRMIAEERIHEEDLLGEIRIVVLHDVVDGLPRIAVVIKKEIFSRRAQVLHPPTHPADPILIQDEISIEIGMR